MVQRIAGGPYHWPGDLGQGEELAVCRGTCLPNEKHFMRLEFVPIASHDGLAPVHQYVGVSELMASGGTWPEWVRASLNGRNTTYCSVCGPTGKMVLANLVGCESCLRCFCVGDTCLCHCENAFVGSLEASQPYICWMCRTDFAGLSGPRKSPFFFPPGDAGARGPRRAVVTSGDALLAQDAHLRRQPSLHLLRSDQLVGRYVVVRRTTPEDGPRWMPAEVVERNMMEGTVGVRLGGRSGAIQHVSAHYLSMAGDFPFFLPGGAPTTPTEAGSAAELGDAELLADLLEGGEVCTDSSLESVKLVWLDGGACIRLPGGRLIQKGSFVQIVAGRTFLDQGGVRRRGAKAIFQVSWALSGRSLQLISLVSPICFTTPTLSFTTRRQLMCCCNSSSPWIVKNRPRLRTASRGLMGWSG